jgi:hypothetical protein
MRLNNLNFGFVKTRRKYKKKHIEVNIMNRYNQIQLYGEVELISTAMLENGWKVFSALFSIKTDRESVGGIHQVYAFGRLALETVSFCQAHKESAVFDQGLFASVFGQFFSRVGQCMLIGNQITFHVHPFIRDDAVKNMAFLNDKIEIGEKVLLDKILEENGIAMHHANQQRYLG